MSTYSQPTPSTPSIETVLADKGVEEVKLIEYKGDEYIMMTVPTGERIVDVVDYLKKVFIDREDCYQDLEMMVKITGMGTDEFERIQKEDKQIKIIVSDTKENVQDLTDSATTELRTPFFKAIWQSLKRGSSWFFIGAASGAAATIYIMSASP